MGAGASRASSPAPLSDAEDFSTANFCLTASHSTVGCFLGRTEVKAASHATIDATLSEAASALSCGSAFVWIVDGGGNLILPPDQVKARLNQSARAPQGFAC
jgi:hypothetical protein